MLLGAEELCHSTWHCYISTCRYCLDFSLRTVQRGGCWWWMSVGASAGYLSPPPLLPLPVVIYPLWVSALSKVAPRDLVALTTDGHSLSGTNTSVYRNTSFLPQSFLCPTLFVHVLASYLLVFVLLMMGGHIYNFRDIEKWKKKKEEHDSVGEEEMDRWNAEWASDTHHCFLHAGQYIKIIKPSLELKVEATIKLTGRREAAGLRRINKANALLCLCPVYRRSRTLPKGVNCSSFKRQTQSYISSLVSKVQP